jgi:glycosyltransferase involved in cell wall biosynthesis
LIHAHSPIPSGFIAFIFSKLFDIPYVFTLHGLDYPHSLILNLEINFTLKNSKRTIVVSNKIFQYLKNKYNLKNLVWIPNGIELSQYYHVNNKQEKALLIKQLNLDHLLTPEDFIISYIGYMFFYQKVKGMIDFIKAFSYFLKTLPSDHDKKRIKLLFIGDGPYSYLLKEAIDKTSFKKNIIFLGTRKEIPHLLAISELLGLTSYIEGNPNVILEAMASKIPCIGSDVGDIKYMIDETGFIVNPGSIQQIKGAIQKYYNLSSQMRQEMGEKAYNRVKDHFNIEKIIEDLLNIYSIKY